MLTHASDRILGGLWGTIAGDALGVPVEFLPRDDIRVDPVTTMRGFGTHRQPAGTWSDDSSLLLCTAESLCQDPFNTEDMGAQFVAWYQERLWTPHGKVFDVGMTTARSIARIASGMKAELAGENAESANGNGSLMRMLPVALRFHDQPTSKLLEHVHRASALPHRHPRSQMSCGLYALTIRELLAGSLPQEAWARGQAVFRQFYEPDPYWSAELDTFLPLLADTLAQTTESEIESGGYVLHTLHASLWCLLTTSCYKDCVLKAVNLGGDTDTTGCVAGGLAGVAYGLQDIPGDWIQQLARREDLERLLTSFANLIPHVP
jgi:ADP-ribosylglycohydrolase